MIEEDKERLQQQGRRMSYVGKVLNDNNIKSATGGLCLIKLQQVSENVCVSDYIMRTRVHQDSRWLD